MDFTIRDGRFYLEMDALSVLQHVSSKGVLINVTAKGGDRYVWSSPDFIDLMVNLEKGIPIALEQNEVKKAGMSCVSATNELANYLNNYTDRLSFILRPELEDGWELHSQRLHFYNEIPDELNIGHISPCFIYDISNNICSVKVKDHLECTMPKNCMPKAEAGTFFEGVVLNASRKGRNLVFPWNGVKSYNRQKVLAAIENEEIVTGRIEDFRKGGFLVDFGFPVDAFMPLGKSKFTNITNPEKYIGQYIPVILTEYEGSESRITGIICSHKAYLKRRQDYVTENEIKEAASF